MSAPTNRPADGNWKSGFDSLDVVDVFIDGPGDTTRRPMPAWMLPAAQKLKEELQRWEQDQAANREGESN